MAFADQRLFLWINGFAGNYPPVDRIVGWMVSDYLVPVSLALTLVAMWFAGKDKAARQKYQVGLFVALTAMALSSLVVLTINAMYFRPRPFDTFDNVTLLFYQPTDSSFPSNAAAAAFGIAFAVWAVNRRVGSALIVAAVLYGC